LKERSKDTGGNETRQDLNINAIVKSEDNRVRAGVRQHLLRRRVGIVAPHITTRD